MSMNRIEIQSILDGDKKDNLNNNNNNKNKNKQQQHRTSTLLWM